MLARTGQHLGEDLDVYVNISHEAMDCCDPVAEDILGGSMPPWHGLSFSSFLRLMEALRQTKESVKRTARSSATIKPMPKKRLVIVAVLKGKGPEVQFKEYFIWKEIRSFPALPPFRCGVRKAIALLEQWIKDAVICLPKIEFLPTVGN